MGTNGLDHWKSYVMACAIWYHLYNLKNAKNTHKACNFAKSNTAPWVFSRFLNCTNGAKSCKLSHIKKYYPSRHLLVQNQ